MNAAVRWLPDDPLPPYSYTPGLFPHPFSDPQGHSFGIRPAPVQAPVVEEWQTCTPYLRGLDLFNFGYYWEAHEAWESLWLACGRSGAFADFFKALIQLAVAGVKLREGRSEGACWHARRAEELLRTLPMPVCMGLGVGKLIESAQHAQKLTPLPLDRQVAPVEIVLPFQLTSEPVA